MTNAEILQKQRDEIKTANSTVVDAFTELKKALKDAMYTFDKANKVCDEDINNYIKLRGDLEKLFETYSKIYASVDQQTGHVGF